MRLKTTILLIFLIFISVNNYGQERVSRKPKIGLVLSGGGAKGLAHIGVLKVLEESGIHVDCITGTSMGSIVGGLYACGYSAEKIESIVKKINWNELLLDQISRKNISIEEKDEYERYIAEFPISGTKVIIPTSMVSGQKVSTLLAHYTWPVHNVTNFDSLPIPFRCIATDIETVTPVVLKNGYLPDAIRASMAIPSYFSPIELDGHLLVDGGIVRNFPVQDARDMGADIIIGVDVSASLYSKKELNSIIRIMDQVSSAQSARSNAEQATMCDILIRPDISKYNMFSFEYMDSLILNGEKAARLILPKLKSLADSISQIQSSHDKVNTPAKLDSIYIEAFKYEGLNKVSLNLARGYFEIKDTGWVRLQDIEHGIDRLFGTRYFERVNYKITPGKKGSLLTLRFKEQNYNYFRFGIHYDPYHKTDVLLSSTFRNILGEGSRLLVDIKIGQYPGATAQYNINTMAHPNLGLNIKVSGNNFQARYYNVAGLLQGTYNINHITGESDLYSAISRSFLIRTGLQWEYFYITKDIEVDDTVNLNLKTFSWYTRFRFDTQDRTYFPIKGDNFFGEIKYIINSKSYNTLGWTPSFWRIIAWYRKYIPLTNKIVLCPYLNGGFSLSGHLSVPYHNIMGGYITGENSIFPFDGMKYMAIISSYMYTSGLSLRIEPWRDRFLALKFNYGGASSDFGKLWNSGNNFNSYGLSAGLKTIVGPVEFTIAKCNINPKPYGEFKMGFDF